MIHLRLGGSGSAARGWVGVLVVALGIVVVLSGLALLIVLGAAAAVIGAGVLLVRRLTGRALPNDRARRATAELEIAPDFEVLRTDTPVAQDIGTARPQRLADPGTRER